MEFHRIDQKEFQALLHVWVTLGQEKKGGVTSGDAMCAGWAHGLGHLFWRLPAPWFSAVKPVWTREEAVKRFVCRSKTAGCSPPRRGEELFGWESPITQNRGAHKTEISKGPEAPADCDVHGAECHLDRMISGQ